MGLLRRILTSPEAPHTPEPLARASISEPRLSVFGESHYQAALLAITGSSPGQEVAFDCIAELIPEPTNSHDPHAVMICIEGKCIGYLSRHNARRLGPRLKEMLDAGQPAICNAYVGCKPDTDNLNLGVSLEVAL